MARPTVTALLLLGLALAGCAGEAPKEESPLAGPVVEGWVVDARLVPVAGATATLAGLGLQDGVDEEGHFLLQAPPGSEIVLVVEAPGFLPQSRSVGAFGGSHQVLNFTLERIPEAAPFHLVESFRGVLRCGVVAVAQEDPARPHEHQGLRCSQALNDTQNRWTYLVPSNTTGIVVEGVWDPQSEVARAMVLRIVVEATGEVLGFIEDMSPVRIQLSSAKLLQERAAGHEALVLTMEPGAGSGNHEHGAVGAFVEQPFELFATTFYNGPVDPAYSITRPA